ncbi:helix-turn-helix domain-containing protein, partial [Streptomyces sp. NPDC006265]|uniref:helix-turn-helix domain-containing protein n=1 Tax=Streptomyces sp. NPDC006265 TaxID=3156740 RepID=UPI0033ABDE56
MSERASSHAVEGHPKGDLGRRITQRRTELGLSRQEAATRAGMAPTYLQYLEERPAADPGAGTLLRLAGALKTTVWHLTGGPNLITNVATTDATVPDSVMAG